MLGEDNNDLQSILTQLLETVNNWSLVLVVAGGVIGVALVLRSMIGLYNSAAGDGNMMMDQGPSRAGGHLVGIIIGSLMTVFSLVLMVLSSWFAGT